MARIRFTELAIRITKGMGRQDERADELAQGCRPGEAHVASAATARPA